MENLDKAECGLNNTTRKFINNHKKNELKTSEQIRIQIKISKFLKRHLNICYWLPKYNFDWGISDLIAGITLGLTIIPESIACALLAGLPSRYGLCSAFIGSFIYMIFGSIDKVIMGPTSLVALVSVQFTLGKPLEFAFILTLLTGIVELVIGSLRLGFIFEFISMPVIKAFSSATAILVIESQIKVLLGIKYLVPGFIESLRMLSIRLYETNYGDLIMGLSAIMFLIIFTYLENISTRLKCNRSINVCFRYLSFSRNTLIVIITASISYIWLKQHSTVPYALSTNALTGLPNITLPKFTIETSFGDYYTFWDIIRELNMGIIVIPIIGILTNISIGKLTVRGNVDTNQELLTVGLSNVLGSCVQSMPTSGAFSRYAISTACGLKTPMANLYSGAIVLLALSFLSPYFNFIPKATLAAILICSIYTLLDFKLPRLLWIKSRRDFLIWIVCFIICILRGVEIGLLISIMINSLYLLYLWAKPDINIEMDALFDINYIIVRPGNAIYFPAIGYLHMKVLNKVMATRYRYHVVIDCRNMHDLDFTVARGFNKIADSLSNPNDDMKLLLIFYNLDKNLQNLININTNIKYCDNDENLHELLKQQNENSNLLVSKGLINKGIYNLNEK